MAIYACADLHGRFDLYQKIKAFIQPEDIVYFLGDACDRGPDGWRTTKAIYEDEQFIYLMGNHEDMLWRAAEEYLGLREGNENRRDLENNGGRKTFADMIADSDFTYWLNCIRNLPHTEVYHSEKLNLDFVMTHSGFTPRMGQKDILWNRDHFSEPWPCDKEMEAVIIVHGHTPIGLMDEFILKENNFNDKEELFGAFWYCGNHKVNLDVGAVWNDFTLLLNLDTLDEEIIY